MAKPRRSFTREFKFEAVRWITAEGRSLSEVARELDLGESLLRSWKVAFSSEGEQAFPGKGNVPAAEEELRRLRAKNQRLRIERDLLKKRRRSSPTSRREVPIHPGPSPGVPGPPDVPGPESLRRRLLSMARPPGLSARQMRGEILTQEIKSIHHEVKSRYGSPRIHAELVARGHACCVNAVARLMRQAGVAAKTRRKFRCTTDSNHDRPVAENVVDRQFAPKAANQVWTADITYLPTREGWLYLAAVEDLFSRRIVGWSMGERIDSWLVVDALGMAVSRRLPGEGLVAHSDRGSQYASEHYQRILTGRGITCSMSRRANCWDNAPMESFFASLKKELVHDEDYATRAEARASLFEYFQIFYNRFRRHSSLGCRSPVEYERAG